MEPSFACQSAAIGGATEQSLRTHVLHKCNNVNLSGGSFWAKGGAGDICVLLTILGQILIVACRGVLMKKLLISMFALGAFTAPVMAADLYTPI